jgi:very-short-patch-repair endonuclease
MTKDRTKLDINEVIKNYTDDKMSVYEIAEKYGTYSQKIRRLLIKHNVPMRDKSEAQALVLEKGRASHPTEGKGHSAETKIKISEKAADTWKNMDDETYKERSELMRAKWDAIPDHIKENMREKATKALQEAAKEGSKMEKHIQRVLIENGFNSIYHRAFKVPGHDFEIDIYLPDYNIAIEIDGPSHFFPIWGEDKLLKQIKADEDKNALLLRTGVKILRIKNLGIFSEKAKRDIATGILDGIKRLKDNETFIELEV